MGFIFFVKPYTDPPFGPSDKEFGVKIQIINRMLNPGVPKCDDDLSTLDIYVEQGKIMNSTLFIYMPH